MICDTIRVFHKEDSIMKKVKVIACVLSAAMLAGVFAGCSKTTKISTEKFAKACEKLKLEEIDFDDRGRSLDEDDYEQGVYAILDEDSVEDSPEMIESYLETVQLDDIIDVDDVKSMGMAIKMKGFDGIGDLEDPDDLTDYEADGAFAIQIDLKENYVGDVMDFVDDMLDTYYINTKDLSGKEYYVSKNDGFVRLHIDIAKLAKIAQENDEIMELVEEFYDADDFEDLCKNLSGDVAVTVEINGSNVFILAGMSLNTKASVLGSFSSAFGANNPAKLPMNTKLIEGLIEDLIEDYSDLLTSGSGYDIDDYDIDDYDFDDEDI